MKDVTTPYTGIAPVDTVAMSPEVREADWTAAPILHSIMDNGVKLKLSPHGSSRPTDPLKCGEHLSKYEDAVDVLHYV